MESLRAYLIGLVAAAILTGIVTQLMGDKGTQGAMIKLISGLFLVFTVIAPIANIDLSGLRDFSADFSEAGEEAALIGEDITRESLAAVIKQRSEAYILDKAAGLDVELEVDVTVSDDKMPVPSAVLIRGKVSPYAKARLQSIIVQNLGIDKEKQIWT